MFIYGFSYEHEKHSNKQGRAVERGSESPLSLDSKNKVVLRTSNGCGIGNFIIPSTGNPSLGIPPLIGSIAVNWPNHTYNVLDTVPGKHIKGVAFTRPWGGNTSIISAFSSAQPYVVVSDTGMFTYWFDWDFSPSAGTIYKGDSSFIPGIVKMANQVTDDTTNTIVLLVEDTAGMYSIRVYSYPDLLEQFNFPFHFLPEIFELTENALFITGWDTNTNFMLYHYSVLQDTLYASYPLNDAASNSKEFLKKGDSLFILSSPGDSISVLTTLHITDSTFSQSVVYPNSGARATNNEYKNNKNFTFQPMDSMLGKQILVLDPATEQYIDTLMINITLDWFRHPETAWAGFGYFSMQWMGARWETGAADSVFIADPSSLNIISLETGAFPKYINSTYGCWVGIPENELEDIKFDVSPNPATSEAIISLSGLKKHRQYILTISDISGRVHYKISLEAYQEITLPVETFSNGVYLLNLDTGKNIISRKLIIQ